MWIFFFWLHWVFVVVHGLCCSREAFPHCRKRGLLSLRCSLQWILLLQLVGSRARASIVVAHRFSCPVSCGILVPNPGIEPMSPALAGGFLTTEPPGKFSCFIVIKCHPKLHTCMHYYVLCLLYLESPLTLSGLVTSCSF